MRLGLAIFRWFPHGGLQRDFLEFARRLAGRGHRVDLLAGAWDGPPPPDGMAVRLFPPGGLSNHARNRHTARQMLAAASARRYDALVGFNRMPGLDVYYCGDGCFRAEAAGRGPLYRLMPRFRQMAADEEAVFGRGAGTDILMLSPREQARYVAYYGTEAERLHPVPPMIGQDRRRPPEYEAAARRLAFRRALGLDQQALLVLAIGAAMRTKGLDRTLRALAGLPGALRNRTRLAVIGAGDDGRIGRLARNQAEWEKFREAAQQAVNTREIVRQRIFFRDGRVLNAVLAPLADGSALMSIRDITDTFNVERVLLERNAALEEANRLKTDFLANASYELRTPLTTISGFAELLSNAVGGPVTAQQQEYLDGILRASETLAALIDSILDISFAEAGQLDINSGDIAIAPLLNSVAEVVRPQIASKGIELAIESAPSLGSVQADERRLRQLVFNLLSSAARLSTANSVITVFAHGNATFIFLEARVATTLGDGTLRALESELSLTLVQRLTELHGGRVEVASDDNQAVSIRCLLVRKRAMPDQSQRASAA